MDSSEDEDQSPKEKQEEEPQQVEVVETKQSKKKREELQRGDVLMTVVGPLAMFEADESNIPKHPAILFAGKRRTGKSTSADNLMFKVMQHIPFGIVMSDTTMNGFWQKRVPPRFVIQGWREDVLINFVARQERLIEKYGKEDPRTFAFIILDDVIADQKAIRYSKWINQFFVQGRHINVTVLITTQYMKGIGPMVRGNMDIVVLQPIYSIADRETCHSLYGGFLPKQVFMKMMDEVVGSEEMPGSTAHNPKLKVTTLVIQDWRQTNNPSLKFKWWQPVHSDDLPKYRLCKPIYWTDKKTTEDKLTQPRKGPPRDMAALITDVSEIYHDKPFEPGEQPFL